MNRLIWTLPLILLAGCMGPAPQDKPTDKPYFWQLVSIDGVPFAARATLAFDSDAHKAFGQGPCNAWSGDVVTDPFPVSRIVNVTATEIGCDDLAAEQAFFAAMQDMTHEGVGLGHLELVDQKGRVMAFVPLAS